jgi:hypothetical protein
MKCFACGSTALGGNTEYIQAEGVIQFETYVWLRHAAKSAPIAASAAAPATRRQV